MNLDEYVSETADAIAMFGRWWKVQRKYQADRFPLEMNVAEWDEQFMAWLSSRGLTNPD